LRGWLFVEHEPDYLRFDEGIDSRESIKALLDESMEIRDKHGEYTASLEEWWAKHLPDFEALPEKKNIHDLYHRFSGTIAQNLKALGILDGFKSRGAFAAYWDSLYTDLRSVAASGWNAELIPDEEILESQFPEILRELRENEARRDELANLFKEVNDLEEGAWSEEEYEAWPKAELAEVKAGIKELGGELKELKREMKNLAAQARALKMAGESTFALSEEKERLELRQQRLEERIAGEEARFSRHTELDTELKQCKRVIREIKERKEKLVEEARQRINEAEAKELILARWQRTLHATVAEYLAQYQREFRAAVENLWQKYHQPLHAILAERDKASAELAGFLKELGYE
jgi:type I restriction enzyme M protein